MSYFGAYLGATVVVVDGGAPAEPDLDPVEVSITNPEVVFVEHTTVALKRLPQYARKKATE